MAAIGPVQQAIFARRETYAAVACALQNVQLAAHEERPGAAEVTRWLSS